LARYLIAKGIGPECLVGIALERSLELVIAIVATLKSGAAYLPLDPDYPQARLEHMVRDAAPRVVLTNQATLVRLPQVSNCELKSVEEAEFQQLLQSMASNNLSDSERTSNLLPQHPAYAIYTSGSTGTPKGAINTHQGIVNRLLWMQAQYGLRADDRVLQKTPFSFDVSVWEFLWPLIQGSTLILAKPGGHRDPAYLASLINEEQVTTVHFVPSMLGVFLEEPLAATCDSLRRVICSGEALHGDVQEKFFRVLNASLHNLYGPTEASVDVTFWECLREAAAHNIPIGRPIWNTRMYVLDRFLHPLPVGVAGELYIGGIGLARGYLNRPSLTAERFIADPFSTSGSRMYQTGDIARWRADGALDFLGRADQQVKIHGFRIELGEIESQLRAHPGVGDAVVVVREGGPAGKELVAYYTPANGNRPGSSVLRGSLGAALPDYMVPSAFVCLDRLPLSPSGKLDRRALPAPDRKTQTYHAPENARQRVLCDIFADLLSLERVGINDSFFSLGGDSILSIQLVSRARNADLLLAPRDVFQHQTPRAIAQAAKEAVRSTALLPGANDAGPVPATPIMRSFFERGGPFNRFHQSMLLHLPPEISGCELLDLLQLLIDTHGALRLRMSPDYVMHIPPPGSVKAEECLTIVDGLSADNKEEMARMAAGRLNPESGLMLHAVWVRQNHRLLLLIHHLAVDGVSWRILLSDLSRAWNAMAEGRAPALEPAAVPFRMWAEHLEELAQAEAVHDQLPFWERMLADGGQLLPGAVPNADQDTISTSGNLRIAMPQALVFPLLNSVPDAFHAQVHEVLLAGLAIALLQWRHHQQVSDGDTILLELEGHGREPMDNNFDLSRTVGWFTTLFPVRFDLAGLDLDEALNGGPAAGGALKLIKDQLRSIPDRGIGYGLLRYLYNDPAKRLSSNPHPQVAFNYLGRFSASRTKAWSPAGDDGGFGGGADPQMPLAHLLTIDALVLDSAEGPQLGANINWAQNHLRQHAVEQLAELWERALLMLANHAQHPGAGGYSRSDFPLASLSLDQLQQIERACPDLIDVLPLSPLQQGLLFHSLYDGAASVYTVQTILELTGDLQPHRLRRAIELLLDRYPNLRVSVYHEGLEQPVQVIPSTVDLPWREVDLSMLDKDVRSLRCAEIVSAEKAQGFMFSAGPLLRFVLVRLAPERHVLMFTNHHLILDGWSTPVLVGEMLELYGNGMNADALPRVRPYTDYLGWLKTQDHSGALAAWKNYLAELESPTIMAPQLLEAKKAETQILVSWRHDLPLELTAALSAMARERGLTLNTVLQGLWAVLLARLSDRNEVVFGITVSGRSPELAGIEQMVGLFINTVPLRVRMHSGECFVDVLARIQKSQSEMLNVYHLGLSEIQREAGFEQLFDTIFVFENYPLDRSLLTRSFGGLRISDVEMRDGAHYPLALMIAPDDRLHVRLDHDSARFTAEEAGGIASRFIRLLESVVTQPDVAWHQLDLFMDGERRAVLEEFNDTVQPLPSATMAAIFEKRAAQVPQAIAIVQGERSMSYGDLNRRANCLAHCLIEKGIGPESLVGVSIDRSVDMVAAIIAIWKAGAAYLSLDSEYPRARLEHMMTDAMPKLVLTKSMLQLQLPMVAGVEFLALDAPEFSSDLERASVHNPNCKVFPQNPAYVIYTSGSTGVPKGVVVTHQGIPSLAASQRERLNLTGESRILQFASVNFDASFWEFLMALSTGATLVLPEQQREGAALHELLVSQKVTHALLPVPVLASLEEFDSLPLHCLMNGGEALSGEAVARWSAGLSMINAYGPTETTVCATMSLPLSGSSNPPIGSPIHNTRVYVLDGNLEPVPLGVAGDLYISGAGLARGYLKRPGLTAERFIADPYAIESGARMYRTGDLARWREGGMLDFVGRGDEQVKVRGFRIELGEIEAALRSLKEVAEAAVALKEDASCGKQLVAYLVPSNGALPEHSALRRRLNERLPGYMLPSVFVPMEELPRSPNGKIDRGALPAAVQHTHNVRAPQSQEESALCAMFAEVLRREQVGVEDDFFALGGDSLSAMRLVGRVCSAFGVALSLRDFYSASTVGGLANLIQAIQFTAGSTEASEASLDEEVFEEEEI
jgi:amino acid adenylation domain-containing protein/non-ribosomal peptide synthase protein (TIGR01720 family)